MEKRAIVFARRHWLELLIGGVGIVLLLASLYPVFSPHAPATNPANAPPPPQAAFPKSPAAGGFSAPKLSPAEPLRATASLDPGPPPHIAVRGAAYDPERHAPVVSVAMVVDGKSVLPAVYGIPDAKNASALHLRDDAVGFRIDAPLADVTGGAHRLAFRVTTARGVTDARAALVVRVPPSRTLPATALAAYREDGGADVPVDAIEGRGFAIVVGKRTDFSNALPADSGITFVGWALDSARTAPAHRLLFRIDDAAFLEATMGNDRLDVANSFHNPGVRFCGFSMRIPASSVPPGRHRVQAYVVDDARHVYEKAASVYTIRTVAGTPPR